MQKMDLSKLQTRKMKGLKRKAWPSEEMNQAGSSTSVTADEPAVKKLRATDAGMDTD